MITVLRVLTAVALVAVLTNCSDTTSPFEPRGEGERVPVGAIIQDSVRADSGNWYSFVAAPNEPFVVFLEALQGQVLLAVFDSTYQSFAITLSDVPGGAGLEENATSTFGTTSGAVYRILVRAIPPGTTARFRFKVFHINRSPEHVPAAFTFGDTVSGETIDPMVDIDQFIAHGNAGQEIVAVAETQAAAGSGTVALDVTDPSTNNFLGYVFADAGTSTPLTTGRIRLPTSGNLLFTLGSVTSNTYPRYSGPYRFWTYVINPAPEHRSAGIPFGTPISGERIDREGDVDEFTFQATAGQEFNAFLQASRAFQLEVAPQGGEAISVLTAQATDTALFAHATGRFQTQQAATYVVRVSGSGSHQIADTGAYRIYLYAVDPRPEHVPAAITPGDTVSGENIQLPGDVDEFTFNGSAGEEFNVFLQGLNGSPEAVFRAEVARPGAPALVAIESNGADTSLLGQATGRFSLPVTGSYRLRVTSAGSSIGRDTGEYRFLVYRINPAPESSPATLTLGDSVTGEGIDVPGDYDRFTLTVPTGTLANLVLWRDETSAIDGMLLSSTGPGGAVDCALTVYSNNVGGQGSGCGTFTITPGIHTVLVQGGESRGTGYRGAYRLHTHVISALAEITPDSVAVGDTVSGDASEPLGDIDTFYFFSRKADHVDVLFQAMGVADPTYGLWLSVLDTTGRAIGSVGSRMGEGSLDAHRSGRIDLTADGWHKIVVGPVNGGRLVVEQGPYRFTVKPVSTAIETASSNLVGGDSVGTERIDFPGDVDRFVLTGPPGQETSILFQASFDAAPLLISVRDTLTRDTLTTQGSAGYLQSTGRFLLPASGLAWVEVLGSAELPPYERVGGYSLKVIAINRAPEAVPALVAINDTIAGEAIDPVGDLDDFAFQGTQGTTVQVYFQTPQGTCCFDPLLLELMDPSTDEVLGTVSSSNPTPNLEDQTTGPVVLPRTDQFRVRVRGSSDRYGAGAFRFRIVEMP